MGTELSIIPRVRRVYRDTYANLPTTGLKVEDLGYATDREIFYRWSGAAWESLTIYIGYGVAADKPAAADLPDGCLYQETDTAELMEVQASAWVCIFYSGSGLAADIPDPAGMPEGALYFEKDTITLKQVQSGAWATITKTAPQIVAGSYTGDDAASRQITTGFKCSSVLISRGSHAEMMVILHGEGSSAHGTSSPYHEDIDTEIHATDGFTVTDSAIAVFGGAVATNKGSIVFDYWAISE